jgi:hypothetical protein
VYMGVPPQQLKDKIMLVRSDEVTD